MNVETYICFRNELEKIASFAAEVGGEVQSLAHRVMQANKGNLGRLPSNTRKEVFHALDRSARPGMSRAITKISAFDRKRFLEGARGELGPAVGATLGAGAANALHVSPVAGAAAGYGLGAIPEIIHGIRHRNVAQKALSVASMAKRASANPSYVAGVLSLFRK